MGLDKLIKREIGITIATVLLVTTVFIMFSYAIFKVEVSGDTNAITFGDLSMSFCADQSCNSTLENIGNVIGTKTENGITKYVPIYPQKDPSTPEEWAELVPYTFTLSNNGTLDLYISLNLTKDTSPDLKYTLENDDISKYNASVEDNQIKIAIAEGSNTPTIKLYSDTKNENGDYVIAKNLLMKAGETKTFHLYAWLIDTADNASQGKYFVTQISARGEFLPESATPTE
jgi:hypothetical protein